MTNPDITASELFASLNGFDELAITKRFAGNIMDFARKGPDGKPVEPMKFARALIFTDLRRKGANDGDAYKGAMEVTIAATGDYFKPEANDNAGIPGDEDAEGEAPRAD